MKELGQPNYILKFDDSQSITINKGGIWGIIQKVCLCIIIGAVIFQILFHKSILGDATVYTISGFIIISIIFSMNKKTEWVTFPIEIHFYDDRLIVIRDYVPYNDGAKKTFGMGSNDV